MQRAAFTVLIVVILLRGLVELLVGLALFLPAIPSFLEVISGTTSLVLASEEREFISFSFMFGGMSVPLLVNGTLSVVQGVSGIKARASGRCDRFIFYSGIMFFVGIFEIVFRTAGTPLRIDCIDMCINIAAILLAYGQRASSSS